MLLALLVSCKRNDIDLDLEKNKGGTYVKFALNGPRENGVYTIEVTPTSNIVEFNRLVSTSKFSQGWFDLADHDNHVAIGMLFPVEVGLFELSDSDQNDMYNMDFTVNGRSFQAKSVSVHITHLERNKLNPMQLGFFKGRFEGVVKYWVEEDTWEDYTVYGDFQYTALKLF